jgi:hypothetical protein
MTQLLTTQLLGDYAARFDAAQHLLLAVGTVQPRATPEPARALERNRSGE